MRIIFKLILFVFIFTNSAYPDNKQISLNKCVSIALQNHPDLFVSGESEKKSFFQYKIAKSISNIQINSELKTQERAKSDSSANSTFNIPGKDTDVGLFAGLTANYSLYDPQKTSREESARLNIDLTKIDSIKVRGSIVFNVKEAYYSYIIAKADMDFNEKQLGQYELLQKQAKIEYQSGVKSILDLTKSNIAFRKSKLKYEKSRNLLNRSKLKLYSSMGIKVEKDFEILSETLRKVPILKFSLKELYQLADVFSPPIRKANFEKKLSKIKISSSQAMHYPKVNVTFSLGYENMKLYGVDSFANNFLTENWTPTFLGFVSASLPVYTGGRISSIVKSSEADYKMIIYKRRNTIRNVRNIIQNLFNSTTELYKQIEISKLIIEDSKKHLLFAKNNYDSGIGAQSELYIAEISVLQSNLELLHVKYDYFIAIAKLSNIIGMTQEYLCKK